MREESSEIKPGDVIDDNLVEYRIIKRAKIIAPWDDSVEIDGYKVQILTGHEAGRVSFVPSEQAERARGIKPLPQPTTSIRGIA
jgi:hypothetical protein